MAYNTVSIKKDVDGKPIPQVYNETKNQYEVLEGSNGASKTTLYDRDGNEIDLVKPDMVEYYGDYITATLARSEDLLNKLHSKDETQTIYGESTETKPTSNMIKGNKYFEIDTTDVYMFNGTKWVEI